MTSIANRPDRSLGVALLGTGFMGKCHALAWHTLSTVFSGAAHPRLEVLFDPDPSCAAACAANFGFARSTDDWAAACSDPTVDVVSITVPNGMHRPMAEVALKAGKHVWLEKPMALTLDDAEAMTALAADYPNQVTILGYNYLRSPAFQEAVRIVKSGEIGPPHAMRGVYDEDYAGDPSKPWSWRDTKEKGGLGALGDLGCHLISHMVALMGDISEITAMTQTSIATRPSPEGPQLVENEDSALALIRFASGAQGSFATSRVALGRNCRLQWEIHGSEGSIWFDQENMNELWVHRRGDAGFTRHLTGPQQPDYAAFCPGPGHNFGFNEQKTIEARDFVRAILDGTPCGPTFAEGLKIERVIHAMARSQGRPIPLGG
ncbi:MAG: Gfo/Idh/MocA family oxidoreductase [Rhodobacter sp.]|nr:Gfo/Idh/MocA family oxidoreductase [Paracoccaceae bacterium]MCC0077367.1 Gfo/Idh/MocA family oxidoreductase [Rhodobacter sp.]